MTDNFVTAGSSSYHIEPGCPALDTARLNSGTGTVRVISAEEVTAQGRPPCPVCASPTGDEWTLTAANLVGLCELIDWSKPHWGPAPSGSSHATAIDGLTIWADSSATGERTWARFGDTIRREPNGRYTVVPTA